MISSLTAAFLLTALAQSGEGWVWTYYDNGGSAVLAREVPDTERLSAVLECEPGSGVARLSVYGPEGRPGFVNVAAGDVSADAERVEADGLAVRLRLDHPLMQAFGRGESLTVSAGEETAVAPAPGAEAFGRFRTACGTGE